MANQAYQGQPARASWGSWNTMPSHIRKGREQFYARVVEMGTDGELNHCVHDHPTRKEAIACAREHLEDRRG